MLAALVGILALAAPVNAQVCEDPDKVKFKDGAACLVDLNVKWNELVTQMAILNQQLNKAFDSIVSACDDLGSDGSGDEDCGPVGASQDTDIDSAQANTDDAIEDLSLSLALIEEAVGIASDFQTELAGFAAKVDGAGSDYGFRDRNRTSVARTAALMAALVDKVLEALGDANTNTGVAGRVASAMQDLQEASAELSSDGADEDLAVTLLATALDSTRQAILGKDRSLRKHLSQVRRSLSRLQSIFKIAMNNPRRAAEGFAVQMIDAQVRVYTPSGALVSVNSGSELSRDRLANGVYVVVHTEGGRTTRVEKLVVLH